jgi:hypothetical protein
MLRDQMCELASCLSKFHFECEVAPLQFLLPDGVVHERLLKLECPLFCCTEAVRELSLRAAEQRVP